MIELKPCPCCGGHAATMKETRQDPPFTYESWFVQCCSCGLRTKDFPTGGYYGLNGTPFMAAYAWNNRRAEND